MRIIFMGTPDFAVPTLDALVSAGHEVVAIYCQPPRRAGRGKQLSPTPVHQRAEALGIEVRHPLTLRNEAEQQAFAALNADVAVVAAYGLILPPAILAAPVHGCLNVHGSLLPRWRGAAPVQRAILAGDTETGITIMQMEKGLDTGPMLLKRGTVVDGKTAGQLTDELAAMGAGMMVEVLADLTRYPAMAQPDEGVTYAAKIDKAESRIDWNQMATQVERQIRAFNPAPGAWFEVNGERIRVHAAQVADLDATAEHMDARLRGNDDSDEYGYEENDITPGTILDDALTIACIGGTAIRPLLIQRAGRGVMSPAELLRGFALPVGTVLA